MLKKAARIILVLLLAVYVLGAFAFLPWWMGGQFTSGRFRYNDKENAGLTPASFQLPFEEVAFRSGDGTALSAWWVPAASAKGTVILVHGLNRSRIEMVKKAPFVNRSGWNALLVDLRHHGESGGTVSTFGAREKDDVLAAVAFARAKDSHPVVVWGVSLGAAASVLALDADPTIAGLICDSTYRSLRDTVHHHLGLFRRFALVPAHRAHLAGRRRDDLSGSGGAAASIPTASTSRRPSAAACAGGRRCSSANSHDRRMPKEIAEDLARAAGPSASLLIVAGESHGGAWRDGTAAYEAAAGQGAAGGGAEPLNRRQA